MGDFGKFGLFRRLCGLTDDATNEPDLTIGVVWYLFPDERHGSDKTKVSGNGRHITYLDSDRKEDVGLYRERDPGLWEKLRGYVASGRRCVHCVQADPVLPRGTQYYDPLRYFMSSMDRPIREIVHERWFAGALDATHGADIVYLDPDTGLAPDAQKFHQDGPKYAYMDDLRAFWERGQSLVIYQQQARRNAGWVAWSQSSCDATTREPRGCSSWCPNRSTVNAPRNALIGC